MRTTNINFRRISKFVVDVHLRLLNVKIKLTLMFPPCYAAVYWTRVAVGGGIAILIGGWLWAGLRRFVAARSCRHQLLETLHQTTLLCLRPRTRPHEPTSPPRTPILKRVDSMEADTVSPAKASRAAIEPLKVDLILASGGPNSPRRAPPAEHVGSPTSAISMRASDGSPRPSSSHSRTGSLADLARQGKRFSMNFPVQAPNAPSSRPTSWHNSLQNSPTHSPVLAASPTENTSFLNKLAAQERRVLELREELKQAELELGRLKKQWAKEESTKKHNEVRSVQKLQPLTAPMPTLDALEDDQDGSSEWLQREMERRKTILNGVKSSNRKVFSGSRHMRTLSLLSPERGHFNQPLNTRHSEDAPADHQKLAHTSTTPDLTTIISGRKDDKWEDGTETNRDVFIKTGRQMAADIKEGLVTFFEDIRQATVGQEGINATSSRVMQNTKNGRLKNRSPSSRADQHNHNAGSSTHKRPSISTQTTGSLIDIGTSFWHENGFENPEPKPAKKATRKVSNRHSSYITPRPKDIDDSWDTWDTPVKQQTALVASSSGSATSGSPTPSDVQSTPLTAASTFSPMSASTDRTLTPGSINSSKRDSIPWPAIQKLSPSNLRRTASHLMNEWEKSLTSPAQRDEPDSYLEHPSSGEKPAGKKSD